MGKINGLAEIVLWVSDMGKSVAFYRDVLGLEVISPPENTSPIFLQAGERHAGIPDLVVLVQRPPGIAAPAKPNALHHIALEISPADFDGEFQRLSDLGFEVRTGQHPIIPSRTMYVDDPDGNEVEIICEA